MITGVLIVTVAAPSFADPHYGGYRGDNEWREHEEHEHFRGGWGGGPGWNYEAPYVAPPVYVSPPVNWYGEPNYYGAPYNPWRPWRRWYRW